MTYEIEEIRLPHPISNNPHKDKSTFQLISELFTKLNKDNVKSDNSFKDDRFKFTDPIISISDQRKRLKNKECWDVFYSKLLHFEPYEFESLESNVDLCTLEFELGMTFQNREWNHFVNLYKKLQEMDTISSRKIDTLVNKKPTWKMGSKTDHMQHNMDQISQRLPDNTLISSAQTDYGVGEQQNCAMSEGLENMIRVLYNLRRVAEISSNASRAFMYLTGNDNIQENLLNPKNQWFVNGQDNLSAITNRGIDSLYSNYLFSQKLSSTPTKDALKIQNQISDNSEIKSWFNNTFPRVKEREEASQFSFFGRAIVDAQNSLDFNFTSSLIGMGTLPPNEVSTELSTFGPSQSLLDSSTIGEFQGDTLSLNKPIEVDFLPTEEVAKKKLPPFKKIIISNSPESRKFRRYNNFHTKNVEYATYHDQDDKKNVFNDGRNCTPTSALYLTELGQDALDQVYNSYFVYSKNAPYDPMTATENDLINDAFLTWQGIESGTFIFQPLRCAFTPVYIRLHSTSVSSIRSLLETIAWSGSLFRRLEVFCQFQSSSEFYPTKSIICQAFANSVHSFLHYYQSCIIKLRSVVMEILKQEAYSEHMEKSSRTTLWSLSQHIRPLVDQLYFVASLCHCDVQDENQLDDSYTREVISQYGNQPLRISNRMLQFPKGAKLLSYLHFCILTGSEQTNPLLLTFFKDACQPYMQWLREWIYYGTVDESNQEFMVRKSRAYYLDTSHYQSATSFWTAAFSLHEENIPSFLAEAADAIISTGRILNVIRKYQDNHYILKLATSEPNISVKFTIDEIRSIRKQYLSLSIFQKAEHQKHIQLRVEKQMQELELVKEKSQALHAKIQKQNDELVKLAVLKSNDQKRLMEERLAEIEKKQIKRKEETQKLEAKEREQAEREEAERQRIIEVAKQRMLKEHNEEVRKMEKRRALSTWKFDRQRLHPLRQNKLLNDKFHLEMLLQDYNASTTISKTKVNPHMNDILNVDQKETSSNDQSLNESKHNESIPQESYDYITSNEIAESPIKSVNHITEDKMQDIDEVDLMNDIGNEIDAQLQDSNTETTPPMYPLLPVSSVYNSFTESNPIESSIIQTHDADLTERSRYITIPEFRDEHMSPLKSLANTNNTTVEDEYVKIITGVYDEEFTIDKIGEKSTFNERKSVHFIKSTLDIPLDQAIEESILKPIFVQHNISHSIALGVFFGELNIEDHFEIIRNFYLLNAGDFSEIFFKQIFDGMYYGNRWTDTHQLNSLLESTLKLTDYYEELPLSQNLSFRIPPLDPNLSIDVHSVDSFKHATLQFEVGWPLNILFDGDALHKYNLVFQFLIQVKRIMVELRDSWKHFTHLSVRTSYDTRIREIQLFRQEIQHFMNIMQSYLMTEVLETSFSTFINRIRNEATTIEALCQLHQEFLNQAIKRCLLSPAAKPVKDLIDRMFTVILQFRLSILSNPLNLELSNSAFNNMKQHQAEFRFLLKQFINILQNKSRELQESAQLLITLNYNNVYY